jgi:tocopherol O-methyltransferase
MEAPGYTKTALRSAVHVRRPTTCALPRETCGGNVLCGTVVPHMHHALQEPATGDNFAAARAREHYDTLATLYRLIWGDHLHHGLFRTGKESPREAQLRLLCYCASLVRPQPDWEVLDVGCGYGATSIYLAQCYGCRCTGLTVSSPQAIYAGKQSQRTQTDNLVKFIVCNAETYPLGSCCYDLVWTAESSEHFVNRRQFFESVAGALRHGGRLLLTCWAAPNQTPELRRLAHLCACEEFQTIEAYQEQISASGLCVKHVQELTAAVTPTWDIVRRRTLALMPTVPFWPAAIRNFANAIGGLRSAFRSRELQYWVLVADK